MPINSLNPFYSTKLISLENYLNEMIELYKLHRFPRVLLLNGKKGLGKFTLVVHFLNYIYTQGEEKSYNLKDMTININSTFLLRSVFENILSIFNERLSFFNKESLSKFSLKLLSPFQVSKAHL